MNQKGIVHLQLIVIATLVVLCVGFTGVKVLHKNTAKVSPITKNKVSSKKATTNNQSVATNTPTTNQKVTANPTTTSTSTPPSTGSSTSSTPKSRSTSNNTPASNNTPPTSGGSTPSPTPSLSLTIDTPSEGQIFTDGSGSIGVTCTTNAPSGYDNVFTELLDSNNQDKGDFTIYGARSSCWGSFGMYMPNGNYTLKMTVHDSSGNTATDSRHITVQVPNNPFG